MDIISELGFGMLVFLAILSLLLLLLNIIALVKLFEKAGEEPIAAVVPFWNVYVMNKIAGFPEWLFILIFVPYLNAAYMLLVYFMIARAFDKSVLYQILMAVFPGIFTIHLGLGDSYYVGNY